MGVILIAPAWIERERGERYKGGDEGRRDAEREVKVNEHLQDD